MATASRSFIDPLPIHKSYGVVDIPGIRVINLAVSTRAHKKYAITVEYEDEVKTLHYGAKEYQQYMDRTPLNAFEYLNHYDDRRRMSYLARASAIRTMNGLACNDPFSPNRYAIITLW
jgi:hypothetical protein